MQPVAVVVLAIAISASTHTAQSGAASFDLDSTFGTGGISSVAVRSEADNNYAVAVQSDGKIVSVGESTEGFNRDFALVRLNPDGSLDTSFDTDGRVTTALGFGADTAKDVAIQSDGKIIAAGTSNVLDKDFAVARYNADGSLDASFSGDGKVATPIGSGDDEAEGVAVQTDGKIVVVGSSISLGISVIAVARYNPDGTLDSNFSGDGKLTTSVSAASDSGSDVVIRPDGRILVSGVAKDGAVFDFAAISLNPDGTADLSFDFNGKLMTSFAPSNAETFAIGLQQDGKVVMAGLAVTEAVFEFAFVRYNTDGSLDPTFDGDGKSTLDFGSGADVATDLAILADGKILLAGFSDNGTNYDAAIARLNTDGSLDTSISDDGRQTLPLSDGHDQTFALAVQPDGKYLLAGYGTYGGARDFTLARLQGDFTPPAQAAPSLLDPTVKIRRPGRRPLKARRLRAFSGTAGPAGQVAKVEIAIRRIDRRLLKRRGRCAWLGNARGRFKLTRAKQRKCTSPRFLPASGQTNWRYKLKRGLKRGRYEIYARVTLTDGRRHTTFSKRQGNLKSFRLK